MSNHALGIYLFVLACLQIMGVGVNVVKCEGNGAKITGTLIASGLSIPFLIMGAYRLFAGIG